MCTIDTWAEFKKQPYLEDVAIKQGRHMKKLNHTSPIWDYMKEFSTCTYARNPEYDQCERNLYTYTYSLKS